MVILAFIFLGLVAAAVLFGMLLSRPQKAPIVQVSPMKATLERRLREGAEFRL